jgi:hypothetical protein
MRHGRGHDAPAFRRLRLIGEVGVKLSGWRSARGFLAVLIAMALVLSSACSLAGTPTSSSTSPSSSAPSSSTITPSVSTGLYLLQQNGRLAATFRAMVPQNVNGSSVDYSTEFFVPSLPITWTGASFRGQLNERGSGEDIVYNVSGLVSADGSVLVSLVYSRLITSAGPSSGTFYQVVLRNLTIPAAGAFQGTGPGVQQYVAIVESGSALDSLQIDWSNTGGGQLPALTVTFSK